MTVDKKLAGSPLLLYDGNCGLCARSVQFVLARERAGGRHGGSSQGDGGTLYFAPLRGEVGTEVAERFPELAAGDSMAIYLPGPPGANATGDGPSGVTQGRLLLRSAAALHTAAYLGGGWALLAAVLKIFPRALLDAGYNLVARHRHRIANDRCDIPTAATRHRFLS